MVQGDVPGDVLEQEDVLSRFVNWLRDRHSGSVLRAWRLELDKNGIGQVSHGDVILALRKLGFATEARAIWDSLRPAGGAAPLSFHELAPKEADNLAQFANTLLREVGFDFDHAWSQYIDPRNRRVVTLEEFVRGVRRLGFQGNAQLLFRGLDISGPLNMLLRKDFEAMKGLSLEFARAEHGPQAALQLVAWAKLMGGAPEVFPKLGFGNGATNTARGSHAGPRGLISGDHERSPTMPVATLATRLRNLGFETYCLAVAATAAKGNSGHLVSAYSLRVLLGGEVAAQPQAQDRGPPGELQEGMPKRKLVKRKTRIEPGGGSPSPNFTRSRSAVCAAQIQPAKAPSQMARLLRSRPGLEDLRPKGCDGLKGLSAAPGGGFIGGGAPVLQLGRSAALSSSAVARVRPGQGSSSSGFSSSEGESDDSSECGDGVGVERSRGSRRHARGPGVGGAGYDGPRRCHGGSRSGPGDAVGGGFGHRGSCAHGSGGGSCPRGNANGVVNGQVSGHRQGRNAGGGVSIARKTPRPSPRPSGSPSSTPRHSPRPSPRHGSYEVGTLDQAHCDANSCEASDGEVSPRGLQSAISNRRCLHSEGRAGGSSSSRLRFSAPLRSAGTGEVSPRQGQAASTDSATGCTGGTPRQGQATIGADYAHSAKGTRHNTVRIVEEGRRGSLANGNSEKKEPFTLQEGRRRRSLVDGASEKDTNRRESRRTSKDSGPVVSRRGSQASVAGEVAETTEAQPETKGKGKGKGKKGAPPPPPGTGSEKDEKTPSSNEDDEQEKQGDGEQGKGEKGKGKGKGEKGKGAPPPPPGDKGKGAGKGPPDGGKGKGKGPDGAKEPRKPDVKPNVCTKKLYWSSFRLEGEDHPATVWDAIDKDGADIDTQELDVLFRDEPPGFARAALSQSQAKTEEDGKHEKPPSRKRLQVLETNRRRQICVMLARLPGLIDTKFALQNMDQDKLNKDQVELLLMNVPCQEEVQLMLQAKKDHTGETDSFWDAAEEFVLAVIEISQFQLRLQVWDFENNFQERFDDITNALTVVERGCHNVFNSKGIRRLLALVLFVGNYLNGGTPRGRADGFALDTLAKMRSVKMSSADRPGTLVDYLVQQMERAHPGELETLFLPGHAADSIKAAARHKLEEIAEDVRSFRRLVGEVLRRVRQAREKGGEDEEIFLQHSEILAMCDAELEELQARVSGLRNKYSEICRWFHMEEKDSKMAPDEFFGVWDKFLMDVKQARKDWQVVERRKEIQERQKKERETSTSRRREASVSSVTGFSQSKRKASSTERTPSSFKPSCLKRTHSSDFMQRHFPRRPSLGLEVQSAASVTERRSSKDLRRPSFEKRCSLSSEPPCSAERWQSKEARRPSVHADRRSSPVSQPCLTKRPSIQTERRHSFSLDTRRSSTSVTSDLRSLHSDMKQTQVRRYSFSANDRRSSRLQLDGIPLSLSAGSSPTCVVAGTSPTCASSPDLSSAEHRGQKFSFSAGSRSVPLSGAPFVRPSLDDQRRSLRSVTSDSLFSENSDAYKTPRRSRIAEPFGACNDELGEEAPSGDDEGGVPRHAAQGSALWQAAVKQILTDKTGWRSKMAAEQVESLTAAYRKASGDVKFAPDATSPESNGPVTTFLSQSSEEDAAYQGSEHSESGIATLEDDKKQPTNSIRFNPHVSILNDDESQESGAEGSVEELEIEV